MRVESDATNFATHNPQLTTQKMKRILERAHARAALAGNPSDGYGGKTISIAIGNYAATVVIYEWPEIEIIPSASEGVRFDSLADLSADVGRNGYYGALRLVKASIKRFHDYCAENRVELPDQNFSIRYDTEVPRGVGMAGSSAIITATFRALMRFYEVEIPQPILPGWVLSVEKSELGIQAGLQDRVAQVYGGLTYMNFDAQFTAEHGHGDYQSLNPSQLPPLYLAFQTDLAEPSDVVHNDLRARYDAGDPMVHAAMDELCAITDAARAALESGEGAELGRQIDANFDVRDRIMKVASGHKAMIVAARKAGASANFAGSGGAIIGTWSGENSDFEKLKSELGALGCKVIVPRVA